MKSISDQIAAIQARSKDNKSVKKDEISESLPKAKNGYIAAPNSLFRSALFPALNNRPRKQLKNETLFSVGGLSVVFTGEQFDQSDLDVYLEILNIAKDYEFGAKVELSAYSILKAINKQPGGESNKWLYSVLFRLKATVVVLKDHQYSYTGSLIDGFFKDEASKHYSIRINHDFAVLFNKGMWSSIDKQQRQAIGKNQTAKSLHAYYSTHTNPAPHKIETLAKIAGLKNKNKYMIPATIIKAHDILCSETVAFLKSYEVKDNKIKANFKEN